MKFTEYLATPAPIVEADEAIIASSAYQINVGKVQRQLKKLQRYLMLHQTEYANTDQQNWAYSGDMARLATELAAINEWMGKEVEF